MTLLMNGLAEVWKVLEPSTSGHRITRLDIEGNFQEKRIG